MQRAITETERRRKKQKEYNEKHGITPKTVVKSIRDVIEIGSPEDSLKSKTKNGKKPTKKEREALIERMEKEMKDAARHLEFEKAAYLRDRIRELREQK